MTNLPGIAARIGTLILSATVAACSGFTYFAANAPAAFGSFRRVADLPYGGDPRQRLDVYSPRETGRHPVVIFFYGGSWTMGQKSQYRFVGAALAARGFVAVVPDYRLYPAVRFPQLMDDGASAVAWAQQHAQEFNGDPDRLVLMGHSAGAHMAALLALNDSYVIQAGVRPHTIVGLVGLSGPYALDPNTDTLRTIFGAPYTPADWQPVQFARDRSPPTLLLHGLEDNVVYSLHTEKLRDALEQHKVRVETHFYPDRGHADTIGSFSLIARFRTPALDQTITFLRSVTAQNGPSR
jgi:acetyl esterase/lipase